MKAHSAVLVFSAAASISGAVAYSGAASGAWVRLHASQCVAMEQSQLVATGDTSDGIPTEGTTRGGTIVGNSGRPTIMCGTPDTSDLPGSAFTQTTAWLCDKNTGSHPWVIACVKFYGADGGACGPGMARADSETGYLGVIADSSVWGAYPDHFKYTYVELPTPGSVSSWLNGISLWQ